VAPTHAPLPPSVCCRSKELPDASKYICASRLYIHMSDSHKFQIFDQDDCRVTVYAFPSPTQSPQCLHLSTYHVAPVVPWPFECIWKSSNASKSPFMKPCKSSGLVESCSHVSHSCHEIGWSGVRPSSRPINHLGMRFNKKCLQPTRAFLRLLHTLLRVFKRPFHDLGTKITVYSMYSVRRILFNPC
jgi:hypothetical protein